SVPRLKDALLRKGLKADVFTDLAPGDLANDGSDRVYSFVRNYSRVPLLRRFHFSRDLARRLNDISDSIELVHSHGLWRMPNIYAAKAARDRGVPHVVSPRGMLSRVALDFSRTSKALFRLVWQRAAIEQGACVHATSFSEYQEVRNLGIK